MISKLAEVYEISPGTVLFRPATRGFVGHSVCESLQGSPGTF